MNSINFFTEGIRYNLRNKNKIRQWLLQCAVKEKKTVGELNYIFCSDKYLLKINKDYLDHDYYTDIITFPSDEKSGNSLGGDIYISIDRVRENAQVFQVTFADEMLRVMVHGLLHLCGHKDSTKPAKEKMRMLEDKYIACFTA